MARRHSCVPRPVPTMPLCCPRVLAPSHRFPSVSPAIFCCIYLSHLCLSCAMHPAVPFHSGCAPRLCMPIQACTQAAAILHSSPCHCLHHCLPLFSHYVIIPTSKKSRLVASSPSPHLALLFSPSSCSFNRISTCPSSNLHGICEVGCHQFFVLSLSESFGIGLTGTVSI